MSKMRLKIYQWPTGYAHIGAGYAWDLNPVRPCNGVAVNGKEGFKTIKAARADAVSWAAQHNIRIVKRKEIIE